MTDQITLRNTFDVELGKYMGDDQMICRAARVSTLGTEAFETKESEGLIGFLMKNRHGSPFEHNALHWRITAPIFVWREFMRHRIGFSYNEQSARYMEMLPHFYVPPTERPLIQVGKAGAYTFEMGTEDQHGFVLEELADSYSEAWGTYQRLLQHGVAKEVARMCLPVATYSTAYVTCNLRSLMAFLSLRTEETPWSVFPSYPQWEIARVASAMEKLAEELFPLSMAAFDKNGRVSP